MTEIKNRFYYNLHRFLKPLARFLWPVRIEGREYMDEDNVILCPNHSHAMDPIILLFALPSEKPLRIMAKKQIMDVPILGAFLKKFGVFGVDRGNSDIVAVKTAIGSLKGGYTMMIFPEGTRVEKQGEVQAKSGVAMMAIRSGVKLQPVYIDPKQGLFRRTRIVFGEAFSPVYTGRKGTAEEYQANADEVLRRAYALGDSI